MSKRRQVAVIIHSERAYHRKILRGIGAYMHEVGNWSLYIEDQSLHKLPDLDNWHGDGIILAFGIQNVIKTACRMRLPTVGIKAAASGMIRPRGSPTSAPTMWPSVGSGPNI